MYVQIIFLLISPRLSITFTRLSFCSFPVDNQIKEAEKEAQAAQEKVERLKQAKIQSAKDSLAKGLSLLKAAKGNFSQTQM